MKNLNKFTKFAWVLVITLIIVSCENTDVQDPIENQIDQTESEGP